MTQNGSPYHYFDHASTTRCCPEAQALIEKFNCENYANPASSHIMGQKAADAIAEARGFFARAFNVAPPQIVFTGSGSEADNLAISGLALQRLAQGFDRAHPPRILISATEHAAVKKTAHSLKDFGFDVAVIPILQNGQIDHAQFEKLLTPQVLLVSVHQVNNVTGALLPVDQLASFAKKLVPHCFFHTDAVQAFGRIDHPKSPSAIDLVSISAHKVEGPKGVGALIILNEKLLNGNLRPLIWGGEQEGGLRSGSQNAGLIAGFQKAAENSVNQREEYLAHTGRLNALLRSELNSIPQLYWNSPAEYAAPYILNFSVTPFPSGLVAKMLEDLNCVVGTGSACSSKKAEPDPVLTAMNLSASQVQSAIRVSIGIHTTEPEIRHLVQSLKTTLDELAVLST